MQWSLQKVFQGKISRVHNPGRLFAFLESIPSALRIISFGSIRFFGEEEERLCGSQCPRF
jgi:hypothetical protein